MTPAAERDSAQTRVACGAHPASMSIVRNPAAADPGAAATPRCPSPEQERRRRVVERMVAALSSIDSEDGYLPSALTPDVLPSSVHRVAPGPGRRFRGETMNAMKVAGIVLIVAGILGLAYGSFSYTRETHDVKLGPLQMTIKDKETVNVPVWAGVGAIVVGGLLLVFGNKRG